MNHHSELEPLRATLATFPGVLAIALGGSRTIACDDARSDFDLYVYAAAEPNISDRIALADRFGRPNPREIGQSPWEPGDEWILQDSGTVVDLMFRTPAWIEDRLAAVLQRYEAQTGYTTCFWHNVLHSEILHDPTGWFARLQSGSRVSFPDGLRRAIFRKNLPLLGGSISSYTVQIRNAIARSDGVSVNHRVAAYLASAFDVVFALNWQPHPGEKRLIEACEKHCARLPEHFRESVTEITRLSPDSTSEQMDALEGLANALADMAR